MRQIFCRGDKGRKNGLPRLMVLLQQRAEGLIDFINDFIYLPGERGQFLCIPPV